jgi:hypothetical protein
MSEHVRDSAGGRVATAVKVHPVQQCLSRARCVLERCDSRENTSHLGKHRRREFEMAGPNPNQEEVHTDDSPKPMPGPNAVGTRLPSADANDEDEDDDDTVEDPNASGDEGGVS